MRQRDWAVVFWIAFLTASAGAFVLFGLVDPMEMIGSWANKYDIGVRLAYGIAFAYLYVLCLMACALTMFMIRTGPQSGHARGKGRRPKPAIHNPASNNPDLDDEDWQ